LILQKDTSPAYGLAVDEATYIAVSEGRTPPVLHLYNFLPSAIVGRYQDIEEALNIPECERLGITYNRRHTGGGTVLMGPKQLALGFSIPTAYPGIGDSINQIFSRLGGTLCKALSKLRLRARYRPKNDIEIGGKKIAGLSASLELRNTAFFHASLLLDFDFRLMLKIFKLPIKKIEDKHISCFTERMTTLKRELHRRIDMPTLQSLVRNQFEEEFNTKFRIDTLTQWELDAVEALLSTKYTNPDWIFSRRVPRTAQAVVSRKTRGGLIEIAVTFSGGVIEAAYITGDYLSTTREINNIESALKYCAADRKTLKNRLAPVLRKDTIYQVEPETIIDMLLEAKERCLKAAPSTKKKKEEKVRKARPIKKKRPKKIKKVATKRRPAKRKKRV
jgi:lipoate-protein ligase A